MMKITFILLLAFVEFGLISGNYEYICTDKLLKKPYLKIYNTRLGDILYDHPPGFYDVSNLNNIYVCTNGPVVLYFTRESVAGDVYDEARNTLDIHKCRYYNGIPGPGSNKKPDHLKAILLLGNEHDYTLPSVKTFTAPYLIKENYKNVTSIITIGAQSCTIFKGPLKQEIKFYISSNEPDYQMCRLAFQTIGQWTDITDTTKKEDLETLLTTENGAVEGECTKTVNPDRSFLAKFNQTSNLMAELKKQFNDFAATDISDKKSEIEEQQKIISDAKGKLNDKNEGETKKEIEDAEIKLSYLEVDQLHFQIYTQAKDIVGKTTFDVLGGDTGKLKDVNTKLDGVEHHNKMKQHWENKYNAMDPGDKELTTVFKSYRDEAKLARQAQDGLNTALNGVLSDIRNAELEFKQLQLLLNILPLIKQQVDESKQYKTTNEGVKYPSSKTDKIKSTFESLPTTVMVEIKAEDDLKKDTGKENQAKDKDSPNDAGSDQDQTQNTDAADVLKADKEKKDPSNDICLDLPSAGTSKYRPDPEKDIIGSCVSEKGTKLFGCQLLKARLGEPGICAFPEAETDNENNPENKIPDVMPASNYLPQHMLDILNLINEIYKKACDRIRPVFAERVNNLLQCYLIKDRVDKNQTSLDGATIPSRLNFWSKIIGALEECRDQGHVLKFARESIDVDKYYLKKDDDYIPIPFLKEQAENEYGFNFAIDMSWKVFATVLGLCMPSYETKIPLITTRFFTMYTEEFLQPIQETWMSEKDNNIFKRIMSYYYGVGGYETWASYCMEASFLYSSDVSFRPPRKLPVNSNTESNYFVKDIQKAKKKSFDSSEPYNSEPSY